MSPYRLPYESFRSLCGWSARLVVLLAMAVLLAAPATARAGGPPQLEKPKGDACIRSTDWMRRNHMDLLKHKRAMTVREGIRNRKESLVNCASCHASREAFCDRCHTYVNVAPGCFECHNYPK